MGNVSVTEETKVSEEAAVEAEDGEEEDCVDEEYLHSPEWIQKEKHVFILSESGKPIYTRYGFVSVCTCFTFLSAFSQFFIFLVNMSSSSPILFVSDLYIFLS